MTDEPAKSAAIARDGLALRVISAIVLVPLAIGTAYVGGWPFALLWTIAALGIAWEWCRMVAVGRLGLAAGVSALALPPDFLLIRMDRPVR